MNYGDVPVVFVILKSFKLRGECGDFFGLDCLEVRVLGCGGRYEILICM